MNLRNHLIEVVAEFIDIRLINSGHEYARGLLLGDPRVLQLIKGEIRLTLRRE